MSKNRVCVLGAGPVGLVAAKNLSEQGLQVTLFEKADHIGGIWHPSTDKLSVLPITSKNTSKQCSSFTDFPYPKQAATHPLAKEVEEYLNAYAKHFSILQSIQLSTEVLKVERDQEKGEWIVSTRSSKTGSEGPVQLRTFDRVVVASGMLSVPNMPEIKGSDKFEGDLMHSQSFKDPFKYEGKRVIVVGVGATGVDTQSFLKSANAQKIYLSHRNQMLLLPRTVEGKAFDHSMSRRRGIVMRALMSIWPTTMLTLMSKGLVSMRKKAFPSLDNHPSFNAPRHMHGVPHRVPMFSDDLEANIKSGIVETVQGISEVSGARSVILTDGTVLDDIDAIIICSGYKYDFSVVPGAGNPLDPKFAPDGYASIQSARFYDKKDPTPRLFRGFISEQYPDSLAFLGHLIIQKPPFVMYDLVTMALASLWSGSYAPGLPSPAEMRRDIDAQYNFTVRMLNRGPVPYAGFRIKNAAETYAWLNEVAGTGVTEQLGNWSLPAWKLWWRDRKFYGLLMDGPDTPFVYRLFSTTHGRKPWVGAKEQIMATNKDIQELGDTWREENRGKKTA